MDKECSIIYYKNNEIFVSNEDYINIINIKIRIKSDDVCCKIENKEWVLNRYIYVKILKIDIPYGYVIDHINNNKLDNRRENLRLVTMIREDVSSKYYGVSYDKRYNNWYSSIFYNNKTISIKYANEIDAAYQYDIFVEKYNLHTLKKNNIEKPKDFKQIIKNNKDLHSGITKNKKNYNIYINIRKKSYFITVANTLESSIKIKISIENVKKLKFLVICEIKSINNKYKNENGNYIFMINDKDIIIDKDMYFNMYKYNWYINKQGYIRCKEFLLSRFILQCDKKLVIDHINSNLLDNRKCNLRSITQKQNTMNKTSKLNSSSSKYIGVQYDTVNKKWKAQIQVDGIKKYLGSFDKEIDAAITRDVATKKYYKEFGKLNFHERPGWDEYFMNLCEVIKLRSPDFCKVGAVLVSMYDHRIISTGYNALRSKMDYENIDFTNREFINDTIIHAEMNTIIYAQNKFEDSILYTTMSPCKACLKIISATQIKKVIYKHEYKDIKDVIKLSKILNIELAEYENIRI